MPFPKPVRQILTWFVIIEIPVALIAWVTQMPWAILIAVMIPFLTIGAICAGLPREYYDPRHFWPNIIFVFVFTIVVMIGFWLFGA